MSGTWFAASHVLDAAFAGAGTTATTLYVDSGVRGSAIEIRVRRWLARHGAGERDVSAVVVKPDASTRPEHWRPDRSGAVAVVVGGGAVLDLVKLSTISALPLRALEQSRSGLVVLPPVAARPVPLVAIPTTLGTGAEASAVAVTERGGRRLLVMGRALRSSAYAHHPDSYLTLPPHLVREGLVEVLSRLVGPYVGDLVGEPLADTVVLGALGRLVIRADEIIASLDDCVPPEPGALMEVAAIGALSHGDVVQRPHQPWGVKLWAMANEVGAATSAPKIPTTAALWPAFWAAIEAGTGPADGPFGSADRLQHLWDQVCATHRQRLSSTPSAGIRELLAHWGVAPGGYRRSVDIPDLVDRVLRAWGAGLPMFHGVRAEDIETVLSRSRTTITGDSLADRPIRLTSLARI